MAPAVNMKKSTPSAALAAVIGPEPEPRTQVVSKLWDYIRRNRLQDPNNRRFVLCDAKLLAVMGKPSVSMFEMQRLLTPHLT